MGDIIHTLPALTDAMQNIKHLEVTWVIEPDFQEIASWHPSVKRIITMPLRSKQYRLVWRAIQEICSQEYDVVIDAQGLFKSAVISMFAKAKIRAGYDWSSVREPLASVFYNHKYTVTWSEHAVIRLRKLFAQLFNYEYDLAHVNYGVVWNALTAPNTYTKPYLVFLHGTTWDSKHWPDKNWFSLADLVAAEGFDVHVTWATPQQQARAQALADQCPNVTMLPHLTLKQAVNVLHNAHGIVAVDTGFAHLAAAIDKPLVAIYGPTDVMHSGTVGNKNVNLASKYVCAPCQKKVCKLIDATVRTPPCFNEITPEIIWQNLQALFAKPGINL